MSKQSQRRAAAKARAIEAAKAAEPAEIELSCPLSIDAAADGAGVTRKGPRRFTMQAYNGGPVNIDRYPVPCVVDISGMELAREQLPVYLEHDRTQIVGHTDQHDKTDGTRFQAAGAVSGSTEFARQVLESHDGGFPWQASISAMPEPGALVELAEGQSEQVNGRTVHGPLVIARRSTLRHIAFVPEGADLSSSVSIAAEAASNQGDTSMENKPIQTEAARVRELWQATSWHGSDATSEGPCRRATAAMEAALSGEITPQDFELALLREQNRDLRLAQIQAERPQAPAIHASRRDTSPEIIEAAFCRTAGLGNMDKHFKPEVLEASDRAFRGGLGLQEMLLTCANQAGYSGRPVVKAGNLREIMQLAFSTHAVTTLLTQAGNKFLLEGFEAVEKTWRLITRIRPVGNFKPVTRFRLTADATFQELPPSGEIKHGSMGQEEFTVQAKTYARMLSLNRPDIINDDLGAFDDLRNRLGRGAGLKLNQVFWAAFLDSGSFFTTDRGNLVEGAAGALAEDGVALAAAEKAFMDLSDEEGNPLGIEPALLLVPTALGVTARKLYASQEMRDTTGDSTYLTSNLFFNRFKPAISAYIGEARTNGSDTAWYLVADPSNLGLMEVAFLDGNEAPTIETADADFDQLGIQTRGYFDFGVTPAEWRAGVKVDGTD